MVVAYDVVCDKKRNDLHELLSEHGQPVNRSVFECEFTRSNLAKFIKEAREIIDPKEDIVVLYPICRECLKKKEVLGPPAPEKSIGPTFIR
jgi:CRISPR-associated protein Cas2